MSAMTTTLTALCGKGDDMSLEMRYREACQDMLDEVQRLDAENAELKAWIIEASSAFRYDRDNGGQDTIEEAAGLVRLCYEAVAELVRLSNEAEYANAWRRLCVQLNIPSTSHVDDVLATARVSLDR